MAHPIEMLTVMSRKAVAEELGMHPHTVTKVEREALAKIRREAPYLADFLSDNREQRDLDLYAV